MHATIRALEYYLPEAILTTELLENPAISLDQVKLFIFQADYGNTVSSTIPIAVKQAARKDQVREGSLIALVGFGVGYSWGATMWRSNGIL